MMYSHVLWHIESFAASSAPFLKPPTAFGGLLESRPVSRLGLPLASLRAMSCQGTPVMYARNTRLGSRTLESLSAGFRSEKFGFVTISPLRFATRGWVRAAT